MVRLNVQRIRERQFHPLSGQVISLLAVHGGGKQVRDPDGGPRLRRRSDHHHQQRRSGGGGGGALVVVDEEHGDHSHQSHHQFPPLPNTSIRTVEVWIRCGREELCAVWQPSEHMDGMRRFVKRIALLTDDQLDRAQISYLDEEGDRCVLRNEFHFSEMLKFATAQASLYLFVHSHEATSATSVTSATASAAASHRSRIHPRRGDRRTRKINVMCDHRLVRTRLSQMQACKVCKRRLWPLLGRVLQCVQCSVYAHEKCRKMLAPCPRQKTEDTTTRRTPSQPSSTGSAITTTLRLADYDLIKVIGRGSYAKVFLVRSSRDSATATAGTFMALKAIKKRRRRAESSGSGTPAPDSSDLDWVHTERRVLEFARGKNFLTGLHSCFQTRDYLFFLVEFIPGGDFLALMQRHGNLSEEQAKFYVVEISTALDFLHSSGILYRDLKLDNVLIDRDGHIKLTDYGLCKIQEIGEKTNTFCGTPNYIAPEILRGEAYGTSVDWWALGIMLFELLAGQSPFDYKEFYPIARDENTTVTEEMSQERLFNVILKQCVRVPRYLSNSAAAIIRALLQKIPADRLACSPFKTLDQNFEDFKTHAFFNSIDFNLIALKRAEPPFIPKLSGPDDLAYFDEEFLSQPTTLTPVPSICAASVAKGTNANQALANAAMPTFDDFEFINSSDYFSSSDGHSVR